MDAQQIQQITDRISLNLVSKGVSPDKQSIAEKLNLYINEFGVVPFEAERKVLSDNYKQYNIPEEVKSTTSSSSGDVVNIADIQPNDWVSVEVKVVSLQAPNSPAIAQSGVFADSTGAVRFVIFSKASELPILELEKWYRVDSAVVDSFKGVPNLKLHSGSRVTEIEDDRCLVPSEPTKLSELKAGVVSCIHVKFIEEWEARSDRMMQSGLVADESGRTKFVLWQDPEK
ncbi:MAG TPA: nucleotide-binding protein, partial [Methanocorpusculum sp.]|nr:nucleotide-binding protein [Methanocorpusculum sp.]